jgi:acyl dehydratase
MPNTTIIDGMDGLRSLAGQKLGASEWKELAYEDIVRFAEATGDFQWIHVDRERCKRESPFGVPIAHGYFSVSRIAGLLFEIIDIRGFALLLNYGFNKVRFPAPLKVGARYRLSLELKELKDIPKGVEALMLATIEIEGESKPACAAEAVYRFMQG